jgi:hypothetical protein
VAESECAHNLAWWPRRAMRLASPNILVDGRSILAIELQMRAVWRDAYLTSDCAVAVKIAHNRRMLANDSNQQKRDGAFFLLLDTRKTVAELMAECRKCGAMTTYGLELAWRLHSVTCPECATSMRLTADDLKALRDQLIQARVRIDCLTDGETRCG